MAIKYWTGGVSGDIAVAGNWSDAAAPLDNDTLNITANGTNNTIVGTLVGIDCTMHIGGKFSGTIGSSGTPLVTGVLTLYYDAPYCQAAYISPTATLTAAYIHDTKPVPNALVIGGAGTVTAGYCYGGQGIVFGGTVTLTALHTGFAVGRSKPLHVTLNSGLTITAAHHRAGRITCESAATTVNIYGGDWYHQGTTTGALTTLNIYGPDGRFYFNSPAFTLGTANVHLGKLDCSQDARAKTITTCNVYPGGEAILDNGGTLIVTTLNSYGGKYQAGVGITATELGGGVAD